MGWNYKNEKVVAEKAKSLGMSSEVFKTIEKEFLENIVEDDDEIDTNDIWYTIIKVDAGSFDALEKLEELVNDFISRSSDTFVPLGPPQVLNGHVVQTLADMDNMDNK